MIEQAAASATVGFEEFFADRYRSAVRFAFLLTGSGHIAEEIAQEAFLQVFRRWTEIRSPDAYLSRALVSGARSWGRKEHRRATGQQYGPVEYDPDAIAVRDALWVLPQRQREASPRRWFIRRSADGTPTGGVSLSEAAATEWTTTFHDAPSAGIAGVDARVVVTPTNAQVGWLADEGVRMVAGLGDVTADETLTAARSAVSAGGLAEVAVPEGLEEVAVPTDEGSVRYEDTQATIGYATVRPAGAVDAAAAALMAPGRDGPISRLPGEDAWLTTTFEGHPTALVAVGTDGIATIVGLPGTDVASLAPQMTVVPARDVTVANPEVGHGIPAEATQTYGEVERGRWVVYEYSTTNGHRCISIDASWGGSGGCTPPGKSDCPVAGMIWGPDVSPAFEVFVPYQADDLAVSLDGAPAAMTIEHAQGFTFAYGPAPSPDATIEITINGQPTC